MQHLRFLQLNFHMDFIFPPTCTISTKPTRELGHLVLQRGKSKNFLVRKLRSYCYNCILILDTLLGTPPSRIQCRSRPRDGLCGGCTSDLTSTKTEMAWRPKTSCSEQTSGSPIVYISVRCFQLNSLTPTGLILDLFLIWFCFCAALAGSYKMSAT